MKELLNLMSREVTDDDFDGIRISLSSPEMIRSCLLYTSDAADE